MASYRRLAALFLLSCLVGASLTLASADEPPADDLSQSVGEELPADLEDVPEVEPSWEELLQAVLDALPEVTPEPAGEEDPLSDDLESEPAALALAPDGFPFYGSCWVQGSAPSLGDVSLFFPTNYKEGYVGLDSSGRLFNVSNNSWSGVMYVNSGSSYTVNFPAFGLPTYRVYSGSSYQNVTLYLTPLESNLVFPDGPSPTYTIPDLLPYLAILLLGGIFICCMRR